MQPILTRSGSGIPMEVDTIEGTPVTGRVNAQILLRGGNALLVKFHMDRGAIIPAHRHDHECYLYVLRGRLRSTVNGDAFDLGPGDAILHPAGLEHMSEALEDSTWIEVKAPSSDRWRGNP